MVTFGVTLAFLYRMNCGAGAGVHNRWAFSLFRFFAFSLFRFFAFSLFRGYME
jgi:hypothetical protein